MHLDDERAQRLLHGELADDEVSTRAHLAECSACRSRFDELGREEDKIFATLRLLDHPATPISARAVMARAGTPAVEWRRWAAAAVFAVGLVGAAYAIPGSPLRRWIDAVKPQAPPERAAPRAPVSPPGSSGVAVAPGTRLVIAFATADSGSRVIVRLVGDGEVVVRGPTGAATYTSDIGRVVVDNGPGLAEFEIDIPTAAPRVEIRVGTKVLFLKVGSRLEGPGALDGRGPFLVPLGGF